MSVWTRQCSRVPFVTYGSFFLAIFFAICNYCSGGSGTMQHTWALCDPGPPPWHLCVCGQGQAVPGVTSDARGEARTTDGAVFQPRNVSLLKATGNNILFSNWLYRVVWMWMLSHKFTIVFFAFLVEPIIVVLLNNFLFQLPGPVQPRGHHGNLVDHIILTRWILNVPQGPNRDVSCNTPTVKHKGWVWLIERHSSQWWTDRQGWT